MYSLTLYTPTSAHVEAHGIDNLNTAKRIAQQYSKQDPIQWRKGLGDREIGSYFDSEKKCFCEWEIVPQ